MKNIFLPKVFCFLVFGIVCSNNLLSQNDKLSKHAWFDAMVGQTNSGLYKGVAYDNEFRVITDRHQFFEKADFSLGSVVFNQQPYFGVQLQYDVFNDNLLIINPDVVGLPPMILKKKNIESFHLAQHLFKNIDLLNFKTDKLSGFVEVIETNDSLSLYKKHSKKLFKRTDQRNLYVEFKGYSNYYIVYKNSCYRIKHAKDLVSIFSKKKRQLKYIHDKYSKLKRSDEAAYLKSVVLDLTEILSENNLNE